MSYILDALRRADDERQRHVPRTPELTPGPALPATARTPHRFGFGVAAAVVLTAAAAWLWIAAHAPPDPAGNDVSAAATPPRQAAAVSPAAPPAVPTPTPPTASPSPETTAPTPRAGAAIAAVALPPPPRADTPETVESKLPPPASEPAIDPPPSGSSLPAWRDLPPTQRQALPHPTLDVHVHAPDPARRFVMIGLQKYREGDTLADGSVLERIDAEGVVLEYRGQRYTLPRR
jgi:general secretion pathway protein B